jgi:hypothetical protein
VNDNVLVVQAIHFIHITMWFVGHAYLETGGCTSLR